MKRAPVFWLLKRIQKHIPMLLIMIVSEILYALLGIWFALNTREVINAATGGGKGAFLQACCVQGGIIVGLMVTLTACRHLREQINADLDKSWKQDLLHVLLRGEYSAVSAYHSGELINRLNNDVRIVDDGLLATFPNMVSMVVRLLGASAALVVLEPYFALVLFLAGLAIIGFTALVRSRLKNLHKSVSEADGKVLSHLQETLENLLLVQAMDISGEMENRTDVLLERRYRVQRTRKNVILLANTCVSLLYYLAGFGALGWCAYGLLTGSITFGDLTAVTQLVSQLQGPLVNLSGVVPKYIAMIAAAERLMELDALREKSEAEGRLPQPLYEEMTAITAENICFSYDRDRVLDHVSFSIPKGSFTVVTGPSGKGKSTLLKLMLGIFSLESGGLYLDRPGARLPLDRSTRRIFAYVPQGNMLLSGTLRDNLTVVKPDATEAELKQALYVSALDTVVAQLPQGMDTVLGESGAGLSEGQAQRLAIARAVLGGAPILLLDESTSNLDENTEKIVLERIQALPNRSCIAVTHRPAALEMADCHLDLAEGNIYQKEYP